MSKNRHTIDKLDYDLDAMGAGSVLVPTSENDDPLLLKQLMKFNTAKEFILFWYINSSYLRNYPHEEHRVTTEDGYLIGLHRIPHGHLDNLVSGASHASKRKPILIWHGLSISSDIFLCNTSRERNFAFVLADAGFDVWLANTRGNKYSKNVPDISDKSKKERLKFWQFTFDHMAKYDVPAVVDYILQKTNKSSLTYIGYSQGTSKIFAALSISEDLNRKISQVIALAPALRPKHNEYVNGLIKTFQPRVLYPILGSGSFLPFVHSLKRLIPASMYSMIIEGALQGLFGWKLEKFGPLNRRQLLYRHLFEDSSITNIVHWFQIIESGEFTMFDHHSHNFLPTLPTKLNPKTVLKYPTKHITTQIHLIYGECDTISDIEYLKSHLPLHTTMTMIKEYEHMDFLWAECANSSCWTPIIQLLSKD